MVVTGLGLLMGERADAGAVRAGRRRRASSRAGVQVPADGAVAARTREAGGEVDDGELLLVRTLAATGPQPGARRRPQRPRRRPGRASPSTSIAVHGQTDQLRLRSGVQQLRVLDAFAGPVVTGDLADYQAAPRPVARGQRRARPRRRPRRRAGARGGAAAPGAGGGRTRRPPARGGRAPCGRSPTAWPTSRPCAPPSRPPTRRSPARPPAARGSGRAGPTPTSTARAGPWPRPVTTTPPWPASPPGPGRSPTCSPTSRPSSRPTRSPSRPTRCGCPRCRNAGPS